ncbi:unnamed protein product [Lactuca virosa]|uniref:DDE Tnp4 domain-containing protein n=1 Tax=Lactuca virosa TaxID=75947 RepID=A0AAU9P0D6_9ASTR|nr:unnamed protein product [Lactuca virosa]
MRGRFKRLSENAQKWVGIYREAWRRRRSGTSRKDIENEAHKLYEASGNKFNDIIVFNEVERAFGVLQARFACLRHPCLLWDKDMMGKIMIACIIIHNMIVEDERCTYLHYYDPSEFLNDRPTNRKRRTYIEDDNQNLEYFTQRIADLSSYMTNRA